MRSDCFRVRHRGRICGVTSSRHRDASYPSRATYECASHVRWHICEPLLFHRWRFSSRHEQSYFEGSAAVSASPQWNSLVVIFYLYSLYSIVTKTPSTLQVSFSPQE